jgi:N-acetylglutamate synthase-like GNAT family acetyltransferase
MAYIIREATPPEIPKLVEIIRTSFQDVAVRFGLTAANCPKHPSNCQDNWITSAMEKGARYFVLEVEGISCGCVALEQASPEVCYLERLAVLPPKRRRAYGKALVDRVLHEAKELGAQRVDIGIIAEHTELQEWYRKIGFAEQRTATFPHLLFRVLFMSLALPAAG